MSDLLTSHSSCIPEAQLFGLTHIPPRTGSGLPYPRLHLLVSLSHVDPPFQLAPQFWEPSWWLGSPLLQRLGSDSFLLPLELFTTFYFTFRVSFFVSQPFPLLNRKLPESWSLAGLNNKPLKSMTSPDPPANHKRQGWGSFTMRKTSLREIVTCPSQVRFKARIGIHI